MCYRIPPARQSLRRAHRQQEPQSKRQLEHDTQTPSSHANTACKGQNSWGIMCFHLFMCGKEVSFLLVFLWHAGNLALEQKDIIDRLGEKLQYWMNFALKHSWDKGFHCLHLQQSWTACTAQRDYSLITLMLYQQYLESTLLVAATAQSNHHASPLIGSHQKTTMSPHLFLLFHCSRR